MFVIRVVSVFSFFMSFLFFVNGSTCSRVTTYEELDRITKKKNLYRNALSVNVRVYNMLCCGSVGFLIICGRYATERDLQIQLYILSFMEFNNLARQLHCGSMYCFTNGSNTAAM